MRKLLILATALSLTATATAAARDNNPFSPSADPLSVAVYGDAPYGTSDADTSEFNATPAFIDSVNADKQVRLVLHVGDIHSGKQSCSQAYDQSVFDLWTRFADPLVYTPGDNEWTDCNKAAEGGGDPIANLALVRSIFFANPGHALGQRDKVVLSQASDHDPAHPTDADYVENVIWQQSRVLFVTINLPGGSNNDNDVWYGGASQTQAQQDEIAQRTGADLRWLNQAFSLAELDPSVRGVVIVAQADMWDPEKGAAHQSAYEPFVSSIASHATAFAKPVLMFNGDSHVYQSGNPLSPGDPDYAIHPGYDVPNFHRVVVHGSTFPLEWLKLTIDPHADAPNGSDAFGPFSWQREVQP